ncbi:unnamed protein product, partial [Ceratitis capitata]
MAVQDMARRMSVNRLTRIQLVSIEVRLKDYEPARIIINEQEIVLKCGLQYIPQ